LKRTRFIRVRAVDADDHGDSAGAVECRSEVALCRVGACPPENRVGSASGERILLDKARLVGVRRVLEEAQSVVELLTEREPVRIDDVVLDRVVERRPPPRGLVGRHGEIDADLEGAASEVVDGNECVSNVVGGGDRIGRRAQIRGDCLGPG